MYQGCGPGVIPVPAGGKRQPQGGQGGIPHPGQSPGRLSPNTGDPQLPVEPFSRGNRPLSGGQHGKILLQGNGCQSGAFRQQGLRLPAGSLGTPQPARRAAEKSQRENCSLVGVDSRRGGQHGPLRRLPCPPECQESGPGRLAGGVPAYGRAPRPVGSQRRGRGGEGENVHIPVAAAVGPVHQAGLGCDAHLVQQGPGGQGGRSLPIGGGKVGDDDPAGGLLQLRDAVDPPGGASPARRTADDAPPFAASGGHPIRPSPIRGQHIQIEKTAQRRALLNGHAQPFYFFPGAGYRVQRLAAGDLEALLPVQDRQIPCRQSPLQRLDPRTEGPAQQGRVLDGSGNIQGEGNHGHGVPDQQRRLPEGPGLPCVQNFRQGNFPCHGRASFCQ